MQSELAILMHLSIIHDAAKKGECGKAIAAIERYALELNMAMVEEVAAARASAELMAKECLSCLVH